MGKHLLCICALAAAVLLLQSCTSSRSASSRGSSGYTTTPISSKGLSQPSSQLLTEANNWLGTPYRYGGNDRRGIDCSGLVVQVYERALSIKLPRSSAQQKVYCSTIKVHEMQVGDLLFFDTSRSKNGKVSHVGIYVGDGRMIHASGSSGVVVAGINDSYFKTRLIGAGRVDKYHSMLKSSSKQMAKASKSDRKGRLKKAETTTTIVIPEPVTTAPAVMDPTPVPDENPALLLDAAIEAKLDSIFSIF